MRVYNMGTEVFEFTDGGVVHTILPKFGSFKRQKEAYTVSLKFTTDPSKTITRYKDVWVKVSDEGHNSNYKDLKQLAGDKALRVAADRELDYIKPENAVVKAEMDKVAIVEKKVKEKEAELVKQEQELNLKMAMLKKVEEEAISKAAAKHK
jgi:hypothetical protein